MISKPYFKDIGRVNWKMFSGNKNPNAIHILEKNMDKINYETLSKNPNAIHLLFKLEYDKMKENNRDFCEELVKKVYHPKRISKIYEEYQIEGDEYFEILSE